MPTWAAPPSDADRDPIGALTGAVEDLAGRFALQPLLERILRRSVGLLGGAAGSICTVDEEAGTYLKVADLGVGCRQGSVFPLAEGTVGAVVAARGPVVFERYADVPGGHVAPGERDRLMATVGVPISWDGAIVGACVVFSTDPARRWQPGDVDLLRVFAGHAAVAITNARLHAAAAERVRRLAVTADRERVVSDVHDSLVRTLGTALTHIDALTATPGRASSEREHLAAVRQAALTALGETRRTVLGLGPALLAGRHLHDAVERELAWVRATTSLRTDLVVTGDPAPATTDRTAPVLHALQEALANVVAHAAATQVRIGIMYGRDKITVLVSDDGRGFDPHLDPQRTEHGGLDRALSLVEQLGGSVDIEATPGWGTRVRLDVPLRPEPVAGRGDTEPVRVLVADHRPLVRVGLVRLLVRAEPDIAVVGEVDDVSGLVAAVGSLGPRVVLAGAVHPVDGPGTESLIEVLRLAAPATVVVALTDPAAGNDPLLSAVARGSQGVVGMTVEAAELARVVLAAARGETVVDGRLLHDNPRPAGTSLTVREQQVGDLVTQGLADKQIAHRLGISVKTVEKHVGSVLRKTGSANRTTLAGRLARTG